MNYRIIAGFAGVGKTTFANKNPDIAIDFVCMPYKYILPENPDMSEAGKANFALEMNYEWPYNYVNAIKEEISNHDKILVIPSDSLVLSFLREAKIPYVLCYPQRDLKEEYRKRYAERGNTEDFLSIFIDSWDMFMDKLESDTYGEHVVLESDQYVGDIF